MMNKFFPTLLACACTISVYAQQKTFATKDYQHAESMLSYNTEALVDHGPVSPNWLSGDRFWYRVLTARGSDFILIDPVKDSHTQAFDQQKVATVLSSTTGKKYTATMLPFKTFSFSADEKAITFSAEGKTWKCDLQNYQLNADSTTTLPSKQGKRDAATKPDTTVLSPDGKKAVFIKDYNLWVRYIKTKHETQLTTDGIKDFGYATDNAGWKSGNGPILRWSPDSRKVATFKQDQRNVSDMYLVGTTVGKPVLKTWKYPLPGDTAIATIYRAIINVDTPKVVMLHLAPDPHRATLSDDISSSGTFDDVDWNGNASKLAFVSTSRDHKQEKFRIANAATGAVREVFDEVVATQYESGQGAINWRYLDKTNEIIWYSERDDWGHLYLYDALTGKLKNQITKGQWVVTKLLKVDEQKRVVYFIADGLEPENPYFSQLCKVDFNGQHFTVLSPESGNHKITLSPGEGYFVDSYSKADVPPVTVLRDINGKLISTLERTDISRLKATGWKAPMPIVVKAHDGKTNLYGLMFSPSKINPNKKYPVIDYIYPGPQGGGVGNWSFASAVRDNQALAELGFVVVVIEGTSNPLRSKSFHDMSYGNMAENTIPDQITGLKQLGKRYPYFNINKVGIWGHSGGGFATATAMFRYPEFFKVGISESGNHDNRNYEDDWGERYNGLLKMQNDTTSNYTAQANQLYAKNLKGKLMLAHGLMDNNVPASNTLLVVEALEKANKNYDLVIFPNSAHGYGTFAPYMMRRRWDYFVKNLLNAEPPQDYELKTKTDPRDPQ